MTEVALIVLALANLYLLVRFIEWVRRPKAAEKVSQGEISFETLREAIRRDREQR